ncbi:MAG: hypothetical protein WBQ45_11340, partial [Roseiarcus sp.]
MDRSKALEASVRAFKPQRNRLESLRESLSVPSDAPLDLLNRRLRQVFGFRNSKVFETGDPPRAVADSPFSVPGAPFAAAVLNVNFLAGFFRSEGCGMFDDDFVQPVFRGHAGATCCLFRRAADSRVEFRGLPRHGF